jgi:hypothetical protein
MAVIRHWPAWRFRIEATLAAASFLAALATVVSREWIELLLRVDPDGGDGSVELWVVVGCVMVTLVSGGAAVRDRRRRTRLAA